MENDGYVYLLNESGDDAMYKIGVSRNSDIKKRIKKLQTGNGNEIIERYKFFSRRPFRLETMLHQYYHESRCEGEWFLLTKEQVEEFPAKCEQYEKIIDCLKDNPYF